MSGNYVLGGGIAGLVWAFYHPEYTIIAEKPGGAMASHLPVGPRYLHATDEVARFVEALGLGLSLRTTITAGIVGGGSYGDYMLKTRGFAQKMWAGEWSSRLDDAMTPSHKVFTSPTLRDVTERLLAFLDQRIVRKRVFAVDAGAKTIKWENPLRDDDVGHDDVGDLEYEKLISTIPLPQFVNLLSNNEGYTFGGEYVKLPVRFTHHEIRGAWPWNPHEYVYVPHAYYPYSRISRQVVAQKTYACFEHPGLDARTQRLLGRDFDGPLPEFNATLRLGPRETSVYFPYGRIISRPIPHITATMLGRRGIAMFGRFAEWTDWLLTHDLVRKAMSA